MLLPRAVVLKVWCGNFWAPLKLFWRFVRSKLFSKKRILGYYLPFPFLISHEYTMEFSRTYIM